jgi:hypothetical protein
VQPTATLEILDPERGAAVARGVAAWAALTAGMGPLAADRAGRAVQAAVRAAGGPVTVTAEIEHGAATLQLTRPGGWPPEAASRIADLGAGAVCGDTLRLHIAPPPLRAV